MRRFLVVLLSITAVCSPAMADEQVLINNDEVEVTLITNQGKETHWPSHPRCDRVLYYPDDQTEHYENDTVKAKHVHKAGEVQFLKASGDHVVMNLGTEADHVLMIEIKDHCGSNASSK